MGQVHRGYSFQKPQFLEGIIRLPGGGTIWTDSTNPAQKGGLLITYQLLSDFIPDIHGFKA